MSDPCRFAGLSGRPYVVAPEEALLFLCANVHPDAASDARLHALLARPIRWGHALDLAGAHGVTGLVRRRLRSSSRWDELPGPVRAALDHWYRVSRIQHLRLAWQLAGLLEGAARAGIDPVVLKGAAVATTAYPDPALRAMVDIDLLVAPTELAPLGEVLACSGLAPNKIYYGDAFNAARGYHLSFVDPDGRSFPVEVHWGLASRLERRNALTAAALLRRTSRARVAPVPNAALGTSRVLAPATELVFLASHAGTEGHSFSQLKWLADIAAIAGKQPPPPWPAVVDLARRVRAGAVTYLALALARDLLGAAVPDAALARLRPPALLVPVIERTLNPGTILAPLDAVRRSIVKYVVVDSPAMTTRLLMERLIPPPDAMRVYHPELGADGLPAAYARQVAAVVSKGMRKAGTWLGVG